MDQFKDGLKFCGALTFLKAHHDILRPMFVDEHKPLTVGTSDVTNNEVMHFDLHVDQFKEILSPSFSERAMVS